jgi:phenylacetate-CoA ligase
MSELAKNIFQHLPSFGKDIAVSAYGLFRNRWRYNEQSPALIEAAAVREQWNFEQWKRYQENQLEKLLHRAYHHIPFYRDHWSKRRRHGDTSSYTDLLSWPIIDKQVVRENTLGFLAEDCNPQKMYHEHTGGTSGSPLNVYWSKETTLNYYAIFERRIRNWHGVTKDTRYGILGGQMLVPFSQNKPPFWVKNFSMNQLYMSSYHISKDSVAAYLEAINSFGVEYLFGYASSLYSIALLGLKQNLNFPVLRVAISNAEPLFDYQIEMISKAFRCPVVNTYGMSELVAAGCSSPESNGLLELWPEVGIIENNLSTEEGRFICTGILNQDMGLVRYNLGDNGKLIHPAAGKLDYYNIQEIFGRNDDLVITREGRRIGRLDTVFKKDLGILEAQIVQEDYERFTLNLVPDATYQENTTQIIVESLKERVGEVQVEVVLMDKIPRSKMGKFRAVISRVALS